MTRKILKEVMTEAAVVDSINAEKRKQRNAPKGFAIQNSVKIQDSLDPSEPEEPPAPAEEKPAETLKEEAKTSLTLEAVQALIQSQLVPVQQTLTQEQEARQKLEAELEKERQEKAKLQEQLAVAKQDQKVLEDLGKLAGSPITQVSNFNRIVGSKSDKPEGALKDWFTIQEQTDRVSKVTSKGKQFISANNQELNQFVKENRKQLIRDLESYAKANGLLRGSMASKNSATIASDILGGFLSVLSSIMRQNNREGYIFWQFATTVIDFAKGLGDNVKIPRAAYLPTANTPEDRLLSSGGTYTRIDSGNQNLSTGTVTAELQEWGLGRNSEYPPVTLVSFVTAYSMIDLISILNRNLMRDYFAWEDLTIRSLWTPTSRVVYNDNSAVVTSPSTITTGDNATLTRKFLAALYGYMKELKIPPFMGNKYGLAVNNTALVQLKQDYDRLWSASTPQQLQALTEYLNPTLIAPGETDRISGYCGDFENFMIFETNSYGTGASGSPGVRTETINSTSQVTRSSFAFGADSIGRGIGTEMEIRMDDDTDFGRADRCIWRSEEAFVAMDVDPTGYNDTSRVPQQLRVIEVRTTTNAI